MQHRGEEAQRALRLGQGHQFDLEMSLLDAQEALADFEANVDSGSTVKRAQLDLMDAAQEAANAEAQMRMEGEAATTAFTNMAEAVGLADSALNLLTTVDDEDTNVFEKIFSPEVIDAIDKVGLGIGFINEELDKVSTRDEANEAVVLPGGLNSLVPNTGTDNYNSSEAFARIGSLADRDPMTAMYGPHWQAMVGLTQVLGPGIGRAGMAGGYMGVGAPPQDYGVGTEQWGADMADRYSSARRGYTTQLETAGTTVGSITIQEMNVVVDEPSEVGPGMVDSIHDSVMGRESGSGGASRYGGAGRSSVGR